MKKLLLSLAIALSAFTLNATPVTVDFTTAEGLPTTESATASTATINGVDFSFVNCKKGTYNKESYIQISGKTYEGAAYMEFTLTEACENFTITTGANASTNVKLQLSANGANIGEAVQLKAKSSDFSWTIPAANQAAGTVYRLSTIAGNKYNAQITKIVFNGTVTPVDPVDPVDPNKLTLLDKSAAAPEDWNLDATVWAWKDYNNSGYLNGSGYNKTLEADAYAISPVIDLTAAKSVKVAWDQAAKFQTSIKEACGFVVREAGATSWTSVAIPTWPELDNKWTWASSGDIDLTAYAGKKIEVAFKYGKTCTDTWEIRDMVFTADAAIKVVEPEVKTVDYANIAAFLTAANTTDQSRITGATTAVYQNGRYLWLKDNSGVVLAYNGGDIEMPKFANGQTVEGGITGKYQNYSNGQLQMSNLVAGTFKAGAQGAEVEAELLQVEEVATDLVNTYVRFEGVTVAEGTAANNYVMSDASGEIALFNQFNNAQYYDVVEVATGTNLTVYGFVAIHSGKLQIMPVKVTFEKTTEGIADIELGEEAPAEYYNLQGVRMEGELTPGLYIRRQGNKATKVIVK